MRLDRVFRRISAGSGPVALGILLFASGLPVSAYGQPPQAPPAAAPEATQPPAATPTPVPAVPAASPQSLPADVASGMPVGPEDVVRMALENNLGVQAARLAPQIQSYAVTQARGAFAPSLFSNLNQSSAAAPPTDFLSTGGTTVVTTGDFTTQTGVQQTLPFGGGTYQVYWDAGRLTSDKPRVVFSPQLNSDISARITQPLLRNFKMSALREQVLLAKNQESVADLQLQARIIQTSRNARAAYYALVGAISGLAVAQESLGLARQSLKDNQTRVQVGTMAPIDIVAAEAEVASNEEAVIVQQANIQTAEDQLRAIVMNKSQTGFWATTFKPTDQTMLAAKDIDVDAAVKNALEHRTDILQFRKQMDANDVTMKFAHNQKLPAVDLVASYGATGVGGTQFQYDSTQLDESGLPKQVGQSIYPFNNVLGDVFHNNFRNWSVGVNVSYPIGTSQAEALYAQTKLTHQQQVAALADLETQVATAVRAAARSVNTNLKRVDATRKARELAERRLEAEQKRFTVGLSTTFELFQAQRDLATARQAELNATIDYNRSVVDFEAVQTAPLGGSQ